MKKLIIVAAILIGSLAANAQELKIPQINLRWHEKAIEVPQVKGKVGIAEFAHAFASAYQGNVMTDELKAQLENPGRVNEDVDEFILDRQNGYCGLQFVSDGTARMEMCYWNRKDGRKLVAVNMLNVYENEEALLMFYNYNPDTGMMEPDLEISFFDWAVPFMSFLLPQTGKDIEAHVYHLDEPAYMRYNGDGDFELEIQTVPAVACFIVDSSPTNIRTAPNGSLIRQLSPDGDYMLDVYQPTGGWWRILAECVTTVENDDIELVEEGGEAWIHYSVLGIGLRNYGGEKLALRESPSEDSKVVGTIDQSEALVNPVDMNSDASWVKVKWGKMTGWISSEWLCANPVTTCP
ncbi:MAG: SH3 domain-containing protein [Bacteroidales bacterium]|nr:SH3 domain-containing protein [Bacteroidales bacterium]